ncbi:unnamed protein product [Citrullus colocynthis]|uniref:Uncharacterized protein n=1 Tax=Citrullus colocynthis TaxID=252529 RepID=A0ABP0XQN0_9ROSI
MQTRNGVVFVCSCTKSPREWYVALSFISFPLEHFATCVRVEGRSCGDFQNPRIQYLFSSIALAVPIALKVLLFF